MDSEFVTAPDGGLVEVAFEPAPGVDPRIIGTYNGNGSMVNADKINKLYPGLIATIIFGTFVGGMTFLIISLIQLFLNDDNYTVEQARGVGIFAAVLGLTAAMFVLAGSWHFIAAKLRYGITSQEAAYWKQNWELRNNCRKPHSKTEFRALLKLAQELDREKAPAYIAEQTANYFARLTDARGLWSRKASSAWLGPVVFQGIMDAQNAEADPNDEHSGGADEE